MQQPARKCSDRKLGSAAISRQFGLATAVPVPWDELFPELANKRVDGAYRMPRSLWAVWSIWSSVCIRPTAAFSAGALAA